MMKIVIDENIAYAEEVFSEFGDVVLLPGRDITRDVLKNSDALIVRSITKVDKNLLEGSKVKFAGTATIGRDHIDVKYLKDHDIAFADAKGCNAEAVKEYVFTALTEVLNHKKLRFGDLTLGIIGVGNIGSKVAKCAEALGMRVILNDPPLKRKTGNNVYRELDEVFKADIITLHVPLNKEGIDKTYHLFDHEKLNRLKDNAILVNSSRGSVIDNEALEKIIGKKNLTVILDVWENEPDINTSLLQKVFIGTPHIAGYSYEGKINGTMMMYSALCRFLNKKESYQIEPIKVENPSIQVKKDGYTESYLQKIFGKVYDIKSDDRNLRGSGSEELLQTSKDSRSKYFDLLRKEYPLRREFSNYTIILPGEDKELNDILSAFRFKVVNTTLQAG